MYIRSTIGDLVRVLAALTAVYMARCQEDGTKAKEECQGTKHVCTSLMKYPDGLVANEGPYCTCKRGNCGVGWSEDDSRELTWKHYERVHWKVQYRFCTPVVDDSLPLCEHGERAAVVKTEVQTWKPYLEEARCRCEDGVHHMTGWKREGSVWSYFYACHKRECPQNDSVCAVISVDSNKKSDIVKEVKFNCACPHGYLCPAKIQDEGAVRGSEVTVKCKPARQSQSQKTK